MNVPQCIICLSLFFRTSYNCVMFLHLMCHVHICTRYSCCTSPFRYVSSGKGSYFLASGIVAYHFLLVLSTMSFPPHLYLVQYMTPYIPGANAPFRGCYSWCYSPSGPDATFSQDTGSTRRMDRTQQTVRQTPDPGNRHKDAEKAEYRRQMCSVCAVKKRYGVGGGRRMC